MSIVNNSGIVGNLILNNAVNTKFRITQTNTPLIAIDIVFLNSLNNTKKIKIAKRSVKSILLIKFVKLIMKFILFCVMKVLSL